MVGRNLHATRAQKRDADPRERHPAFLDTSWALAGVVLDRVGFHLEAAHGLALESASKNMPAQLSWIVFPAKEPWWAPATQMPHGPREMRLPTTLASLLARSGPKMVMPVLPKRLTSLERILVPVESRIAMPPKVLSVMSLERILVRWSRRQHAKPVAYEIVPRDGGIRALVNLDRDWSSGCF